MAETLELGDDETALVLRADGTLELCAPDLEDLDIVPDDVLILSAVMMAFREQPFRDHMLALFSEEFRESNPALS